jgi:hypothetical protein
MKDKMATQRVSLAKIGGAAARVVARQFELWEQTQVDGEFPPEVQFSLDNFAEKLRANSCDLPIVYFAEWIDMWSMGNLVPELGNERATAIIGRSYWACCHAPPIVFKTTTIDGDPPQESHWLKRRLDEATDAWDEVVPEWVIVLLREPLAGTVLDNELLASLSVVPTWLSGLLRTSQCE